VAFSVVPRIRQSSTRRPRRTRPRVVHRKKTLTTDEANTADAASGSAAAIPGKAKARTTAASAARTVERARHWKKAAPSAVTKARRPAA
jgi:hypothetical protein